jgi:protein-tyrosine-phosphatase
VLFLCTGNSARSQIAEALVARMTGGGVKAASAGSHPKPLYPNAVQVMRKRGIDISGNRTKHLDEFMTQRFDAVITLCDRVREVCPEFPSHPALVHWSMPDPAQAGPTNQASWAARVPNRRDAMTQDLLRRDPVEQMVGMQIDEARKQRAGKADDLLWTTHAVRRCHRRDPITPHNDRVVLEHSRPVEHPIRGKNVSLTKSSPYRLSRSRHHRSPAPSWRPLHPQATFGESSRSSKHMRTSLSKLLNHVVARLSQVGAVAGSRRCRGLAVTNITAVGRRRASARPRILARTVICEPGATPIQHHSTSTTSGRSWRCSSSTGARSS